MFGNQEQDNIKIDCLIKVMFLIDSCVDLYAVTERQL